MLYPPMFWTSLHIVNLSGWLNISKSNRTQPRRGKSTAQAALTATDDTGGGSLTTDGPSPGQSTPALGGGEDVSEHDQDQEYSDHNEQHPEGHEISPRSEAQPNYV